MKRRLLFAIMIFSVLSVWTVSGQTARSHSRRTEKPKLVVNIVVSGMRYEYIERYRENFTSNGFLMFADKGVVFTEARYDFMQTNTPATLATLTTGCNPSVHGVIGDKWQDYVNGETVTLIDDASAKGLGGNSDNNRYSSVNLTVPTLADEVKRTTPRSKTITIAADPVSAVAMGGFNSEVYWFDTRTGQWVSSSKYMLYLPGWVVNHNDINNGRKSEFLNYKWTRSKSEISYKNSRFCILDVPETVRFRKIAAPSDSKPKRAPKFEPLLSTPLANDLVAGMAQAAITYEDLGKDQYTDILNICFDAPRKAIELYGPESMEAEDMLYKVDATISSLISFINAMFPNNNDVLYVLTADHGSSDSYDVALQPKPRFNGNQFRIIMNTFLGAQFGNDNWVSAYYDRRLYINRTAVYNKGVSLEDVQTRAANFALQFRGISNALTATSMQSSSFSDSYLRRVQNGFYPRRSGDIAINLLPGWIDEDNSLRATSGSLYEYDTHVPLMVVGYRLEHKVVDTPVDMSSVAPTLARIIGVGRPQASTAPVINELTEMFK